MLITGELKVVLTTAKTQKSPKKLPKVSEQLHNGRNSKAITFRIDSSGLLHSWNRDAATLFNNILTLTTMFPEKGAFFSSTRAE